MRTDRAYEAGLLVPSRYRRPARPSARLPYTKSQATRRAISLSVPAARLLLGWEEELGPMEELLLPVGVAAWPQLIEGRREGLQARLLRGSRLYYKAAFGARDSGNQ